MRKFLVLSLLASVAACGGGGGGSDPGSAGVSQQPGDPASFNSTSGGTGVATVSSYSFGSANAVDCCTIGTATGNSTITMTMAPNNGGPATLTLNIGNEDGPGINQTFNIANDNPNMVPFGNGYSTSATNGTTQYTLVYAGASEPTTNPDGSAHTPSLTYTTYGYWSQANADQSGAVGVFAGGQQTPASTAPGMATATYNGGAMGVADQGGNALQLVGTSQVNANFGSGAINGNLNLQNAANGAQFDNVSLNGNIVANTTTFSGATAGAVTGGTGKFAGQFNGPAYDEVGGTWSLAGNGVTALGSFGGSRH